MLKIKHPQKLLMTLLLICSMHIFVVPDTSTDAVTSKKNEKDQSIVSSQATLVCEDLYPISCQYIQTILHEYSDKVSEVLFVMSVEQVLQSHKTILMIPCAWISGLEQQNPMIDKIIRNYIARQMQSSTSWYHRIDWGKVSIVLIVGCLAVIAVHLYKIERLISRIDNNIKSNTLFWLCTLPNQMRQKLQNS